MLRPFQSLRHAIALGVALCVLLPALLLGGVAARDRYTAAYHERVTAPLQQYADLLVHGLASSLWNIDADGARQLADAVLNNPDVVRVSVEDASLGLFVHRERAERRVGEVVVEHREILRDGRALGYLTIELTTGRVARELRTEAVKLGVMLLVQLAASFMLIILLLESRLFSPLRDIRDAAQKLASGEFDHPVNATGEDEIGALAKHLDEMRVKLKSAFDELEAKRLALEHELDERGRSEAALNANHEFTLKVIESLPGIFYLIDADGHFVLWNQNFERVTGRDAAAMAVLHPLDIFSGEDRKHIAAAIAEVFKVGQTIVEASITHLDGSRIPYLFTGLRVPMSGTNHLVGLGIDVSERKRAEEALRISEEKFSAAINGSVDFISLSNLDDGRFTLVNEAFEELTGWQAHEAIGRTSIELGIWRDPQERSLLADRLRRGERVSNFYLHLGTRTGEIKECVMSAVAVSVSGIPHMVAVVRDVSEQRRADRAMRRLAKGSQSTSPEEFYKSLVADLAEALEFETSFIGLCHSDDPGRISTLAVHAADGNESAFSYDVSGTPCEAVFGGEISVFADDVAGHFPEALPLLEKNMKSYIGAPLRGDDGEVIGVLVAMDSRPIRNTDLARSLVQVFAERAEAELARERTHLALIASQHKFSALFHSSPVAMTVSRREDNYAVVDVNEAWERQFLLTREQVQGTNGPRLGFWRNPEDRAAVLGLAEREGEVRAHEAWLVRGDGGAILCQISGRMIALGGEQLLILAEEDITEKRRIERELSELNASLEQRVSERTEALRVANSELSQTIQTLQRTHDELVRAEKLAALGSLVAGIAHELNTPIGNCITVASTLDEQLTHFVDGLNNGLRRSALDSFTASARLAADILLRNLRRASELVVSFKQVAVDQTSSQRRQFLLEEVVAEIVLTLQPSIRRTPYVVDYAIPPEIICDSYPGPLGQVISNLINNALLHGFDGRAAGKVSIRARQLEGETFELSVSDDGVGIPEADQSRIYDPFFTTKLGKGGSGLGLNIVYNLVTRVLGGEIAVNSRPGQGASFVIVAPLIAPRDSEKEHENENASAPLRLPAGPVQ
ncbi:MAG: PAS domain S-box protein [Rhodocyclaceae bacterium]